jgi:hypothetical protein
MGDDRQDEKPVMNMSTTRPFLAVSATTIVKEYRG